MTVRVGTLFRIRDVVTLYIARQGLGLTSLRSTQAAANDMSVVEAYDSGITQRGFTHETNRFWIDRQANGIR